MKGQILAIDENKGIILGEDDKRYEFELNEWKEKIPPLKGAKVDFEIENKKAKNIYLLEIPKPDILTALQLESNIKIFGGVGALFIIFSWIPYIGLALYILGLIFLTIAFKKLSDKEPSKEIFKNWIISILISVIGGIIIFIMYLTAIGNTSNLLLILTYLFFVTIAVIIGILYKKIFIGIYELTNESLFKTAANIFFWSSILAFIFIGGFLFFIGWIVVAIAFFSLKTQEA